MQSKQKTRRASVIQQTIQKSFNARRFKTVFSAKDKLKGAIWQTIHS